MKIINHLLIDSNVTQTTTPNKRPGTIVPKFLVFHYTAGPYKGAVRHFETQKASGNASAHLVIARDGAITQLVPFNVGAWHAGESEWRRYTNINQHSIGIEIENWGFLTKTLNGYVSHNGTAIANEEVVIARHNNPNEKHDAWQNYTQTQIALCHELASLLVTAYRLEDVVGHDDISPGRKVDPGPAFPMMSIRGGALGRADGAALRHRRVTTGLLNVRKGPGVSHAIQTVVMKDTILLEMGDAEAGWRAVQVDPPTGVTGWVYDAYTTLI